MRIRELRETYGIQQKELASVIGISPNTLSQYENEKREPGLEIISKLADYFNVTSDFIYGLSDITRCDKCGLEYSPLIKSDVNVHSELHNRWEKAIKKYGTIYSLHSENERIKAQNRDIVNNFDNYPIEEVYKAQLEVFRCLFSRSLSALNYNETHVDFATYVSMLLNQTHFKKTLNPVLYNKLVDEYGVSTGIPYGTYYEPSFQISEDSNEYSITEIEILEKYHALDEHGKEMVDFTLEKEYERSVSEKKKSDNIISMTVKESSNYEVNAAHERTDIEVTDEMRKHDDDIMNDENF